MKVAVLTMFNGLQSTYSLVNVAAEHLRMFLDANIHIKVLVSEHCPDDTRYGVYADERIEWVKVVNSLDGKRIEWFDYALPGKEVHKTFYDEAHVIATDLVDKLSDVDICFMHDIHYQGWHLVHNVAVREAQKKLPHVRFVAVTHSAPYPPIPDAEWPYSARYSPMPNTIYVYPTQSGIPTLARQYNVSEDRCRVVSHSLDLLAHMSDEVKSIASEVDLLSADILMVYPGRLTQAKKFDKVAAFAGAIIRKTGLSAKVIYCDFPSRDIKPIVYKAAIELVGEKFGIGEQNIVFTSDYGYRAGIPRKAVLDLFTLSNLFVCPSFSESFGLTVVEAASRGNFLVLNEAVPALKELGDRLNAYYMRWDACNFELNTKETYEPSEQGYLEEHAEKVIAMMTGNPVMHAKSLVRQRYSPRWVWKNQLEPLLMG